MVDFIAMPKIPRLSRECIITEKIDGTNASIYIGEDGEFLIGSRTRWITPEDDNFGFAKWAKEHEEELRQLGPGHHFGEWWGSNIQRGYGLADGEREFSLFNVSRWEGIPIPSCVSLVPVLYKGEFSSRAVDEALFTLETTGSRTAIGFRQPEGIVIYHTAAKVLFKKTLKNDNEPKGLKP